MLYTYITLPVTEINKKVRIKANTKPLKNYMVKFQILRNSQSI